MTTDALVETLLASETVEAAFEVVRVSRRPPLYVGNLLAGFANEVVRQSPATSAAAAFLAQLVWSLDEPQEWVDLVDLPLSVNAALRSATASDDWVGALSALREVRGDLDERAMIAAVSWHSTLAQSGFSAQANGAATVVALGVLAGGRSHVWARLIWARSVEAWSVERAAHHLHRGRTLATAGGWPDLVTATDLALDSLDSRFGRMMERRGPALVEEVTPVMLPLLESRAADLRDTGDLLAALEVLEKVIPVAVEICDTTRLVRLLDLRGLILDDLGHYGRAEDDFRESARLAGEVHDDQQRFQALGNAAFSHLKRGEPLRALPLFRRLVNDADAAGVHTQRIAARNNLANALVRAGEIVAGRDLYLEAWRMIDGRRDYQSFWITSMGLADVYERLGDREGLVAVGDRLWSLWTEDDDPEALRCYLLSAARDLSRPEVRDAADRMADLWTEHGDLPLAGGLTVALSTHATDHGDHEAALARLETFLASFEAVRSSVAVCIRADVAAAAIESDHLGSLQAASDRLRSAVTSVEQRLAETETGFAGDWVLDSARPLYHALIDLLLRTGTTEAIVEAYWLHEACRATTLTTGVRRKGDEGTGWVDPGFVRRVAGLDEVRQALRADESQSVALVSFLETSSQLGAFMLAPDDTSPEWVPLAITPAEVDSAAAGLSLSFNGDPTRFPPRRPVAARNLEAVDLTELDRVLDVIGEVIDSLPDVGVVALVPSRSMEGLPLHALRDSSGRRLVELASVVVQPSLSALVVASRRGPRTAGPPSVFVAGVASREDEDPTRFEDDALIFERLALPVRVASGTAATASAVLAGVREASVAHLSCHGFVDAMEPMGSGLLVSDGTRRPTLRTQSVPVLERRRFELTVQDLADESLDLDLATLRACSTARRSAIAAKEENSTLMRAMQLSGCRVVVSTLWNVDQESSLALFSRFYARHLGEGRPAGEAMALTQREMIASGPPYSHPYHWAPYTVSGDWRI